MPGLFIFDAYGTLFDVHACIARFENEAGPDIARMSEIWRARQLEYTWTLTLAGHYIDFWTLTERALDYALARAPGVPRALKPRPEVYALVTERFQCRPCDVTFVSSNRWDVIAAVSVGFRTLWINRTGAPDEYPDFQPAKVLKSLTELASMA